MAIKRVGNNFSVQFRRDLQRAIRPQGLGIVYSNDKRRTLQDVIKRYQAMEVPSSPVPQASQSDVRQYELYGKFQSGQITFPEFRELLAPFYPTQYTADISFDIMQLDYYNYISKFKALNQDERLQRAGLLRQLNNKIQVYEGSRLTASERQYRDQAKKLRFEQIKELNRQGYVVGEKSLIFKGNGKMPEPVAFRDLGYTPANFSQAPFPASFDFRQYASYEKKKRFK